MSEPIPIEASPVQSGEPDKLKFEDFQRIDIRAAKVLEAERVPSSSRLLKLKVDIGGSEKQCLAGIGTKYDPSELTGKMIAVVTNLVTRKIMGLESEVMLLAASDGTEISALVLDRQLSPGAKIS